MNPTPDELTAIAADLRREITKALPVIESCLRHLGHRAEANAALHCAPRTVYPPLHAQMEATRMSLEQVLNSTEPAAGSGSAEA